MDTLLYILHHFEQMLPTTVLGYTLHIIGGLVFACVCGSFFEHLVHKHIMHRGLPLFGGKMIMKAQQHNHEDLHHGTFYKKFDYEDDPAGREISITFTAEEIIAVQLTLLLPLLFIAWFSPIVAICFSVVAFVHNNLWNIIHREMHQPKHPSWSKWAIYRLLARHHFLHHQHIGVNYNVIFPFADYILGKVVQATTEDRTEIVRLGYSA